MEHLDSELARALVAGELDPAARARWVAHLERCPRCVELVRRERTWSGLLKLDIEPPVPAGGAERLVRRLQPVSARAARRACTRAMLVAAALGLAAGVAAALAYRLYSAPSVWDRSAARLGISPAVQQKIIANLDALETLAREPWLLEHYEATRWLERLIRAAPDTSEEPRP